MKMKILILFALVAMVLSASALAINITHLNLINKSKYQVYIKGVGSVNPNSRWSHTLDPGDEAVLSVVTEPYWVQASARTVDVEFMSNELVYGEWELCYGFADRFYWDDNRAARLMSFGNGYRKIIIRPDTCGELSTQMRLDWMNLAQRVFEYSKTLFAYDY